MQRHPALARLERDFGIIDPAVVDFVHSDWKFDYTVAMDAQPSLVTTSSAGIPFYLANYMEPKFVEVLLSPNKAATIFGEVKKGDWTTRTATFPVIEHVGEVSSYGDWNNNGSTNANPTFPMRQSYHYQTMTQWGERQLEDAALAKIDWASRLNIASAIVLNKFQNKSYFFGIAGLQNYGALNDSNLSANLTPGVKVGGTSPQWITNGVVTATANEVFTDIQTLFSQLVTQSNSLIDANTSMTLVMSPNSSVALTATNSFNVNVSDLLKKNFPNISFETAPEYATTAGNLVQLIAKEVEGQEMGYCAYTEKMRAHSIVKKTSSFEQKKSQGTWGFILMMPICISSMIGV